MGERTIRLVLEYDGSRYFGWQRQRQEPTVQGVLEKAVHRITGERSPVIASGRTDAGVHALHQVCHFRTSADRALDGLKRGLNALTPNDIFIKDAAGARPDFHARYSAKSKTYEYRILNRPDPDVFTRAYAWHVPAHLDFGAMQGCTDLLKGQQDFTSFRSSGSTNVNPVRDVMRSEIACCGGGLIRFVFEADGFLRHMVRNMVGTVVEVGRGRFSCDEFSEILRARDRRRAGTMAPPQGLYLTMVDYG